MPIILTPHGDTLTGLIPEAARHPLLGGPGAFYAGTPSGAGSTTTLVCSDLIDNAGARTYSNWNVYVHTSGNSPALAGQARRVSGAPDLTSGTITVNRAYAVATGPSDLFWLLRDFTRNDWRDFANQALRDMKRRVVLTQVGSGSNVRRYTPPAGIVRAEDVVDVRVRAYPEVGSEGQPRAMRWWSIEDNDAALALVVSDGVGSGQELVYYVLRPYAAAGQDTLTTDADTVPASVPREWLVAEMVARATVVRWTQATEADKSLRQREMVAAAALCEGFRKRYMAAPSRRLQAPEASW